MQSGEENKWNTVLLHDDAYILHLPNQQSDTEETKKEPVELEV